MRYLIGMFLVLALGAMGCVSTITRAADGTTTYQQNGMVEVSPTEVAAAHATEVVADAQARQINARANTEDAWGDTLREQPALVFDFLERMNPWRFYGGQWGSQRAIGQTDPCQFGPPCGVPLTPVAVPAGGVQ